MKRGLSVFVMSVAVLAATPLGALAVAPQFPPSGIGAAAAYSVYSYVYGGSGQTTLDDATNFANAADRVHQLFTGQATTTETTADLPGGVLAGVASAAANPPFGGGGEATANSVAGLRDTLTLSAPATITLRGQVAAVVATANSDPVNNSRPLSSAELSVDLLNDNCPEKPGTEGVYSCGGLDRGYFSSGESAAFSINILLPAGETRFAGDVNVKASASAGPRATGSASATAQVHVSFSLVVPDGITVVTGSGLLPVIGGTSANTPAGAFVTVAPVDATTGTAPATLTFDNVTAPGNTTLTTSSIGPSVPAGFQLGTPPIYYELATTASFSSSITVCVDYSSLGLSSPPRLLHYEAGAWVDTTATPPSDPVAQKVCGRVTSLSPFAVATLVDATPPTSHATIYPQPNAAGWNDTNVTVRVAAVDTGTDASGVKELHLSLTGPQTANTVISGDMATILVSAEGATTLTYFAVDNAGNHERARTTTVRIDKTLPLVSCAATPDRLWPPDRRLMPVTVSLVATDALSGVADMSLSAVTVNEPNATASDVAGFIVGSSSASGELRATRDGAGTGRVYALVYQAHDAAGNAATCTALVTVPHDER